MYPTGAAGNVFSLGRICPTCFGGRASWDNVQHRHHTVESLNEVFVYKNFQICVSPNQFEGWRPSLKGPLAVGPRFFNELAQGNGKVESSGNMTQSSVNKYNMHISQSILFERVCSKLFWHHQNCSTTLLFTYMCDV